MPRFSLIVPVHNHAHCLPCLLDSFLVQYAADMEVVIVDDCSDKPCNDIVEAYINKGLKITLVINQHRLNTKNSRLVGVRAANGRYIGFADADDTLIGQTILRDNIDRIESAGADILHFRSVLLDKRREFISYFIQADPFGSELCGKEIFNNFVKTDITSGAVIWNKIFSKKLFLDSFSFLEKAGIEFYCEDLFLNSVLLFNATKYIHSHDVGYGYTYENKIEKESLARALAMRAILEYVLPFFNEKQCDPETLGAYIEKMNLGIGNCMGRVCLQLVEGQTGLIREEALAETFGKYDAQKLMQVFVLGGAVNAKKLRSCFRVLAGLTKELA